MNGSTWSQQTPATSPPARGYGSMAFDPINQVAILFGGGLTDTWAWNGSNWIQQHPSTSPPAPRWGAAMTFDGSAQLITLTGGYGSGTGNGYYNDTWQWTGSTWSQVLAPGIGLVSLQASAPRVGLSPSGGSEQLDAVATFSDGSQQDVTQTVAWSANTGGVVLSSRPLRWGSRPRPRLGRPSFRPPTFPPGSRGASL